MMLKIEEILAHIKKTEYIRMWEKTTICLLTLDNWYEVVWSSACIDPKDFDEKIGQHEAQAVAIDKMWELYWFLEHQKK